MRDRRIPVAALADGELELVLGRGGGGGGKQRCRDQCNSQLVDTSHYGLPSLRRNQSSRLGTLSGRAAMRNRALYRRVKPSRVQADGVYVTGTRREFQPMPERKHVKLFRHGRTR